MYNEYEKGGRVIRATPFAYEAIYKAQGYVPATSTYYNFIETPMFGFTVDEFDAPKGDFTFTGGLSEVLSNGEGRGDSKDNGAGDTAKPRRKRNKS